MTPNLPEFPSIEQLRHQAKDLVKRFAAHDAEAVRRVQAHLPRAAQVSAADLLASRLTLSEAQWIVAREYGFPSWPKMKQHVEALQTDPEAALEAFKLAVNTRDSARLKTLLRTNPTLVAQIDAPLFSFDSPAVLQAAHHKDRKTLEVLLEHGASINARSQWWAGGFGVLPHDDLEFAEYLVERGAVIDVWAAAGMNRLELLQEMLQGNPVLANARGGDGQGPLHFADSVETARILLEHGAQIEMRDIDHGSTPAQWMVASRPEVCRYLLSQGAEADIFMAVQLGDMGLVQQILADTPDSIHARVNQGRLTSGASNGGHIYMYTLQNGDSPLYLAAALGHEAIYRFLLAHCSPTEQLLAACLKADESAVRALLAQSPDIVASLPPEQMRLIADAAWKHNTEAVRLMLDIGFDIEARGSEDSTALNRAAVRGFADLIELLLARGADVTAKNVHGGDALGACLWGAENFRDENGDYPASVQKLLDGGATLPEGAYPCRNKTVNAVLRRYVGV